MPFDCSNANTRKEAENGITTVTFPTAGIYTVTLTPTGTAKTGYCKITFDGTDYYTPQLITESFTFTVNAAANTALTVTPRWGTYSGTVTIQNGDEITAAGSNQSNTQTPDNGVNNEPTAENGTTETAEPTTTSETSTSGVSEAPTPETTE